MGMKAISQKKCTAQARETMPRRPSLFWDVDPKTVDPDKHARYIIERVLDFGNDAEVRWLYHSYPRALIRDVVESSRVLEPDTRALWRELVSQ